MPNLHKITIGKGTALGRAFARVSRARQRLAKYTATRDAGAIHADRFEAGALILLWEKELSEALGALATTTTP